MSISGQVLSASGELSTTQSKRLDRHTSRATKEVRNPKYVAPFFIEPNSSLTHHSILKKYNSAWKSCADYFM